MALTTGTKLGPYEIVAPLGAGGMGEVYRARDTKLGREVALKLLPSLFEADPDRVARFEREARLLASLNHAHIGTIYGFQDAGNAPALVLELVEGETLEDRIRRGPLPLSEGLALAQQIADALDAAHRAGVIHRDLKPSNIKITPDGVVKVLDFGLAKALAAESSDPHLSNAATMTAGETMAGVILGSASYMSPEQARGQPVDKRTDIWAFGCVLFEMLTGSSAFRRGTVTDTIAAVVGAEPDWKSLPAGTPDSIRRLLARCLQKDTRRRLHDIADARIELEETMATPAEPPPVPRPRRWSRLALSTMSFGIVAVLVFFWMVRARFRRPVAEPAPPDTRIIRLTDLPGLAESPAISPDGRSMAFTAGVGGKRQVFVQLIAGGAPLQITRGAVDHEFPRWSPDSSSILYFSPAVSGAIQGSIWEIPALGGMPRRLVNSLRGADVSLMDERLAFFRLAKEGIQLVTAPMDGSRFEVVAEFAPTTYYLYPRWSPDGRWIAFQQGDSIRFDIFVVPATGGKPQRLTHDNNTMSGFAWLPDSTGIIYSSGRDSTMPYLPTLDLWRVTLRDGKVRRVTSSETSYLTPDISKSGAILVSRMRLQTDVWKFPFDGLPTENVRRGVRVTRQTGQVLTPTASHDDKEVAFLSDSGGHANLWVVNTESGGLRQITNERDPKVAVGVPVWSPDGRSIAFVCSRGNPGLTFGVWLVDPDGGNLHNLVNPGLGPAWSPDGRWVYYSTRGGAAATVLKKVPVDGGPAVTVTAEPLRNVIGLHGATLYYTFERPLVDGAPEFDIRVATPENTPFHVLARIPASRVPIWQIVNPALSPDGKWMAQALTDGFTTNIWALSTTTGEWRQITDFGERATFIARRVSWSSDGRSILAAVAEGIDLVEPAPDETTVCKFRHLLEEQQVGGKMLEAVNLHLEKQGIRITSGTIVDATIIHAPSSTKNRDQQRDPEMHQTRKGKDWYFGMKGHVGVDSKTKLIHSVVATPANVADSAVLPELLHGEETRVWGDGAYQGQTEVIHQCAPRARDCTQRRCRYKDRVDEVERARNRNKSRVRSKVEHVFGVMKLKFGFVKVRYRGLKKNANRLFATCALVNLFMVRRKLLRWAAV